MSLASLQELSYALRLVRDLEYSPKSISKLEDLRDSAHRITWLLFKSMGKQNPPTP